MKSIRSLRLLVILLALVFLFTIPIKGSAKWWDKFGTPEYGGTINLPSFRINNLEENIDPWYWMNLAAGWHETLFAYDWTLDRGVFAFQGGWVPDNYIAPCLAESWKWKDPKTMEVKIRKGILWQKKAPVNGRKFTAHDVQYHFDRMLGKGSFTKPNPEYAGWASAFDFVEAKDDYTLVIHFSNPTLYNNILIIFDPIVQHMEARECVEAGNTNKWENAVGTGAFLLTDMVSHSSMTLSKNPDYWGLDERHPKNRLPYVDTVKYIAIGDMATEVAAMRTGKIDMMIELDQKQAKTLAASNPKIVQLPVKSWTNPIWFRIDNGPFSDIRIRKAMTLAVDRNTIGKTMFGTGEETSPLIPPVYTGFSTPYKDWPAKLKTEYAFDLKKAKDLMAQAGYPKGFKTELLVNFSEDMELMKIYKSYFANIGVEAEIKVMDPPAMGGYINARKHTGLTAGMGGLGPPPSISLENAGKARNNNVCNDDPVYEKYLQQFRTARNVKDAKKAANSASMYVMEQHWTLGQVSKIVYNIWQPYLKGYSGECGGSYYSMQGWYWARYWIDQSQK